jgi:hypothetical protein
MKILYKFSTNTNFPQIQFVIVWIGGWLTCVYGRLTVLAIAKNIHQWIDERNMEHAHSGTLFGYKKGMDIDTGYNTDESWKTSC